MDPAQLSLEAFAIVAAIVVLLALSALFNASETALTATSKARMHALEEDGNPRASTVNTILRRPERMIGTVLLGNTLVDVLAASLATSLGLSLFGPAGVAYATAVVTVLIVIFSAVLPKTYALANPDRGALLLGPVMRWLIWLLTPFTIAVEHIVRLIFRLTPTKIDDKANILAAQEELRGTIELGAKGGTVAKDDADMLGGILDLGELTVGDIMVHRTRMETVNEADAPAKIVEDVVRSQYTRLPVWRERPENIVGVLHTKDMLAALGRAGWDVAKLDIRTLTTPAWFVPETTLLKDQLNQFQRQKSQMAFVVDEYGEVKGLVTIEDILEEIVGQISDEHDTEGQSVRRLADGAVQVEGSVPIRDLNRDMDWELPDEEATTIAGLVIHEAQTIPEAGQVFTFHGYRFEILKKSRNKITSLRVRRLVPTTAAAGASGEPDQMRGG